MKLTKLSENLYSLRKGKGLSQEEFAEQIHVSRQAISKWERGEAYPDIENLIAIAEFYGITIDELVGSSEVAMPVNAESSNCDNLPDKTNNDCSHNNENNEDESDEGSNLDDEKGSFKLSFDEIPYSVIITVIYLALGFLTPRGWQIWWTLFITIPVYSSLMECIRKKRFTPFAYPIFITFLYLLFGMMYGLWHPTWIIFITVPIYYSVAAGIDRLIKKKSSKK